MYIIYISLYFFETCQTISIYSCTECRVFHIVTFLVRKIFSFYINAHFQNQRFNIMKCVYKLSTYRRLYQSLQTHCEIMPRLFHCRFLPFPFQFAIYKSFFCSELDSLTSGVLNAPPPPTLRSNKQLIGAAHFNPIHILPSAC